MARASGDSEVLRGLLHEDFRWTTHVGQVFDRDEYIRRNTEGVALWRSQTLGASEVTIVGETAVLLTVVTDGAKDRRSGSDSITQRPGLRHQRVVRNSHSNPRVIPS